jgi:hypothetical protein
MRRWAGMGLGLALAMGVLASTAGAASAQGATEEARELFRKGVQMADEQRWGEAVQYFRQSRELMDRDSTVFNLAVALFRAGKYRDAITAFEDFLRMVDPKAPAQVKNEAQGFLRKAKASVAKVQLTVSPENAVVSVDGETLEGTGSQRELVLDPGPRRLRIEAPSHLSQTIRLSLMSGAEVSTQVELVPLMGDLHGGQDESARRSAAAQAAADGRAVTFAGEGQEPRDGSRRSVFKSPWFWVATGVVLAAVGVGLGVGLSGGGGASDPYGGSTGVIIRP